MVQCIKNLVRRVDSYNFDVITNELKYDEYEMLYDCWVNLKYSEVEQLRAVASRSFKNQSLKGAMENREATLLLYEESHAAKYDPVRPRVIQGLTESFIKADLNDLSANQQDQT